MQHESKFLDLTGARYPSAQFTMEEIDRPDKRDQNFTQERYAVEQGDKLDAPQSLLLMADEEL